MAITTRQTGLLVAEDWTKLYQTFRNADFQSYDFETLRASMINYLRLYYPEDFNDFIDSSEFVSLIDLIAFLGQSLAFRSDLNARENFIDTAQRRDSILKLARLISYNPKRNISASGFLKINSVSTTESIFDSNGFNLAGLAITWADSGNDNWLEQFTAVVNGSLVSNQIIGKPSNSQLINGILNEEYQIRLVPSIVPTYSFNSTIGGTETVFEMVSPTSSGEGILYEVPPRPNLPFNLLYKNDNLGNSSLNTGFFMMFKQGSLKSADVAFTESIPNRGYSVTVDNINNSDVWVYRLDATGNPVELWEQVPSVNNTNVIYNQSSKRNIYQVATKAGDQIDLIFGDGAFSNIPQGNFRIYYRVSNGLDYKITPSEMQGIVVPINYISRSGRIETITIRGSLQYTVANATSRDTIEDIRQKAPQQFYTQNRMVTGEDYNILPYTLFNDILKIKAVNRTSSGISRYLDVIDVTGKYSSTNIFCQDGMLYRDPIIGTFNFDYNTNNDIYKVIYNQVVPLARQKEMLQYYYSNFPLISVSDIYWNYSSAITNGSTGYFFDASGKILQVGPTVASNNKFIQQGAIVRFSAGQGNYFDARNTIQTGTPSKAGDKINIYAAIEQLLGDGTNGGKGNLEDGTGPIILNQIVPQGAIADRIFSVFNIDFSDSLINTIVGYIQAYENFGLRYDVAVSDWKIILPNDVSSSETFDLSNSGNTSGQSLDSSWLIRFETVGQTYTVYYRNLNYVFESVLETDFYFDEAVKIFDATTGTTVYDQIKILKTNSNPDDSNPLALDYTWYIFKGIFESDGYENSNKILITFPDSDNDGVPDNPELFELIVAPEISTNSKYVFFRGEPGYDNFIVQTPVDNNTVLSNYETLQNAQIDATLYRNGQLFYFPSTDEFYQLSIVGGSSYILNQVFNYTAKIGRQDLYFQYRHNSPNYRRIDPSPNNIVDLYVLTKQYATDYTAWIRDTSNTVFKPVQPTNEELSLSYSSLENFKSISDTIIYNPAEFKPIFGAKADPSLRATFKVIKNPNIVISDYDIQTSVISAINDFFAVDNWDFGETFYFSELAAYLHTTLAPNVASVLIVPASSSSPFGSLMQINADVNEIVVSAATVDDVQIISAITAAQLNVRSLAIQNNDSDLGFTDTVRSSSRPRSDLTSSGSSTVSGSTGGGSTGGGSTGGGSTGGGIVY